MSKKADSFLADHLDEREDGLDWDVAVSDVSVKCGVQSNTAEQYIRRSPAAVIEETADGRVVKLPKYAGTTITKTDDEIVEQPVGKPTGKKFGNIPILQDVGHPEVPTDAKTGYIRRRMNPNNASSSTSNRQSQSSDLSRKTDVQVVTSAMADPDFSTLLIGKHGVGKDYLIMHICANINQPVVRLVANDDPDFVELLIGTFAPDENGDFVRQKGLLQISLENGYCLVLDEFNNLSGKVQTMLNKILEDSGKNELVIPQTNEVIEPHEEFRFVGTMNPNDVGYGGREELDQATGSRFIPIKLPALEQSGEKKVVAQETNWDEDGRELRRLLDADSGLITGLRNLHYMGKLPTYISTRDVIQIGRMSERLGSPEAGAEIVLSGRVGPEHEETVRSEIYDTQW